MKYPQEKREAELGSWGSAWCSRNTISLSWPKSLPPLTPQWVSVISEDSYITHSPRGKGSSCHSANRSGIYRQLWCTLGLFLLLFFIVRILGCFAAADPCLATHMSDNFWLSWNCLICSYLGSLLPHACVEGKLNAVVYEGRRPPKALVGAQQILPRELWSYSTVCSVTPVLSPFNVIHLHKATSPTCCSSQGPFPAVEQSWML